MKLYKLIPAAVILLASSVSLADTKPATYFTIKSGYNNTVTTYNGDWTEKKAILLPKGFFMWTCERSAVSHENGNYKLTVSCEQKNGTSMESSVRCSSTHPDSDASIFTIKAKKAGEVVIGFACGTELTEQGQTG